MKKGKVAILIVIAAASMFFALCTNLNYSSAALNRFTSYEELKEFLLKEREWGELCRGLSDGSLMLGTGTPSLDYSKTNIQVEGVDEADIVKTDGDYIYLIANNKVVIVRAYPAESAAVLSRIAVNGTLNQMFINDERLVLFYENRSCNEQKTFISIFDVSDKEHPIIKDEIAASGQYFSSRMIGDYVYVLVMKQAYAYNDDVSLPKIYRYKDTQVIRANEIYYSSIQDYAYMYITIMAVNVQDESEPSTYQSILIGYSAKVYVSLQNIYLAIDNCRERTIVYRIQVDKNKIAYAAYNEVPGVVLNQFSMDEHEGYFRIATTSWGMSEIPWFSGDSSGSVWQNNIYTLDMNLSIVGTLEGIAPGEQINSARFMGNMCYLVTFRKVDPFFVISLSDPRKPKVLGELKITGYSDYLHPFDENHVIGVGKETVADQSDWFSWYQGVKISLFDVADVSRPEQLAKYEIGDRGTDSPVLRDHKAFLFSKHKELLVMPVSVAEINESRYPNGIPPNAYGDFVWQGAYVFTISLGLEEKIMLKGTITHVENGNLRNSAYHVKRALYIEDVLYTISDSKIKMNSLFDLSEIGELNLKEGSK